MSQLAAHGHCHFCGQRYDAEAEQKWPRYCSGCTNRTWKNPVPVLVVLVSIEGGLLTVRRAIEPALGKLALPGGYMEMGESWQDGASRELREETGISVPPTLIGLVTLRMSNAGNLLVFCQSPNLNSSVLKPFVPNSEVSELVVLREPADLAFSTHTEMARRFFQPFAVPSPT